LTRTRRSRFGKHKHYSPRCRSLGPMAKKKAKKAKKKAYYAGRKERRAKK
jgi:hypothetical protein